MSEIMQNVSYGYQMMPQTAKYVLLAAVALATIVFVFRVISRIKSSRK